MQILSIGVKNLRGCLVPTGDMVIWRFYLFIFEIPFN